MNTNVGELNYGICKMINGEMHFFPCEFDAGTIMRQMSEYAKVLQERRSQSNLRVEAPVFVPNGAGTIQQAI